MAKSPVTYDEVYRYLDGSECKYAAEGCTESRKRAIHRFSEKNSYRSGIFILSSDFGRDKMRDKVVKRFFGMASMKTLIVMLKLVKNIRS